MGIDEGMLLLRMLSARPVAYNPDVARIVGSVKAAVFLCQLLYWTGKGKRRDGFIFKSRLDWEEETALSRYEQEGARKILRELGILEEELMGVPATLHFRVNQDQFIQLAEDYYTRGTLFEGGVHPPTSWGKTHQLDGGKPTNKPGENQPTIPENTQRVSAESTPIVAPNGATEEPPKPEDARPIGLGHAEHNLDEEYDLLEDTGIRKNEVTAQCECGATHQQDSNVCPGCKMQVVWFNSPIWKKMYGDPHAYRRRLNKQDLSPATPLEVEFCHSFHGKNEFASITEKHRFRKLQKAYPEGWIREKLAWVTEEGARKSFASFETATKNEGNYRAWRDKEVQKYEESSRSDGGLSPGDAKYDFG